MAKKHRLTRACHRNAVKNKRNAKPGLRHRFKPKVRKSKYWSKLPKWEYIPTIIDYSTPYDGGVEACKARVASGIKCFCVEVCHCRECGGCKISKDLPPDDCIIACRTCSNHIPCK